MQKVLSCLLSFALVFANVTPSLAQIRGKVKVVTRRTATTKVPKVDIKIGKGRPVYTPKRVTCPVPTRVTPKVRTEVKPSTHLPKASAPTGKVESGRILNHATQELTYPNIKLLTPSVQVPAAIQILEHSNAAERALLLRSDFPALALNGMVQASELAKGVKFYRSQLEHVSFADLPADISSSPKIIEAVSETVADISSLGVTGETADAALIFDVYKKSVGTAAEPIITSAASHALLRLGAYEELAKMSELSNIHPELWDGIASYAKTNDLPISIAKKQRTAVEMKAFQASLDQYGQLPSWAANVTEPSTALYMNAGCEMGAGEVVAGDMEVRFTPVDPAVETGSRELYASAGAPVANTQKVQPLMQAPLAHPVEPVAATPSVVPTTPKYIKVETTNALGQKVESWRLNPEYVEPAPKTPASSKNFTFFDRLRVDATSFLAGLHMFVKSRYAWALPVVGGTPLVGEAAVRMAPTVQVVEHVRAVEREFISPEEFIAGSGASHRTGRVNAGGLAAQRAAGRTTASTVSHAKPATKVATPSVATGASKVAVAGTGASRTSGVVASSLIPLPKRVLGWLTGNTQAKVAQGVAAQQAGSVDHAFRDQGLASEGLTASFPVYGEDREQGKLTDVIFQFEDQATKEAFYKRVDLASDEYFVFDAATGAIVIRKQLTAEQKANGAKPQDRGFNKIFFEGAQKVPTTLHSAVLIAPAFASVSQSSDVMSLLAQYRGSLKKLLSKETLAKHTLLNTYLSAEGEALEQATDALSSNGDMMAIAQDISNDLNNVLATPIKVFKDDAGYYAQLSTGLAEGTFGTMGQAITSALSVLGISKGWLSNTPTSAGQMGPAWAPFIGAWAQKYGIKKMLNIGQWLGTAGHLTAAASLTAGALGILPALTVFAGMVAGITVNGIAGSINKQLNPMLAKQRAADPISASATITDLNAWASVGGMFCYLFLPAMGGLSWLFTGSTDTALGALAAMFAVAASFPLTANLLLHKSRIQNNPAANGEKQGVFKTIANNLKSGFKSPFIRSMFLATAGAHFMGLGFNSGPGNFIKENISNPSIAMAVSFLAIYLTVFAGRKLGANAMKKGIIGDKALAGLSGMIGVTMGAASLLPGLDFVTRCTLFAAAGMGFANWANVLQSIELNRPENADKRAAVSTMYILARTSGMLTGLMGAFGDHLGASLGLSSSDAALYALTMPLAAGALSMGLNYKYITKELWPTAKRWGTNIKKWVQDKLHKGDNGSDPTSMGGTATAQ